MPQVASDPKIHASSHHLPRVARPALPDRAPSPFESLLEDTPRPAEPAPPQPENRVSVSDDAQAPARSNKSKDSKTVDSADDTKQAKPDNASAADDSADEKPVDENTATKDSHEKTAKFETPADVGDSIQPDADHEQTSDQTIDDASAAPPTGGAVPTANADAITAIATAPQSPAVTDDGEKQIEPPLQQATLAVESKPQMNPGIETSKSAAAKKTDNGKQADTDNQIDDLSIDQTTSQTDDTTQILAKDTQPQHAENKTHASEGDKQHVTQGRNDLAPNSNRPDAGGPNPPGPDISALAKAMNDARPQTPMPGTAPHASENAAAPAALVSQPGPQPSAVPLSGVAIEIAGKALAGKNRFDIRLDPPELGRIDVRLDVDRDGNVTSRLTVDRPDTLDLLRRDATGLERALQDAGLKTANNGLQFSLRDQSLNDQQNAPAPDRAVLVATDDALPSVDVIPQRYGRLAGQGSGLDIRV